MKNKKFLKAIAAITLSASAALGAFGLAACGHTHNFEWENSDPNQHWKVCREDGEEEPGSRANHDFSNGDCVCGAKKPAYTATFKNGETVLSTATAGADGKVSKPADPTTEDSTKRFNGWKTEGGALFDFNTALTADVTLVADWRTVDNLDLLVEAGGVLYQNRFNEAATVDCIGGAEQAPATGIYGTISPLPTGVSGEDFTENLKVTIADGVLKLSDVGPGTVNAYIKVEKQTLKKVHIYAEVTPLNNAGGWDLLRFLDGNGGTIASVRSDGNKKVGVSVDGGTTVVGATIACTENVAIKVEAVIDLGTGKISVKLNGTAVEFVAAGVDTPAVTEADITATDFSGLSLMTANGSKATDTRNISLDNVGIRAEESAVTLDELQTKLKTALTAKYTAYGVETNYKTNSADLIAAHTAGLAAIEAAETNEAVLKAYNDALAAMAAVESDAAIALKAAKEAAKTALDGYKNAADYTINGEALTAAVNAGKTAIEGCTTTEAVTAAETAAKAEIDKVKSDATLLSEKQTAAKAELAAYKDASNYTYESNKAAYDKAIEGGNAAIEGVTIGAEGAQAALTAVDTALANAKAELDKVDTNETVEQNASLAEVKAANKLELETYAENKKKADEGDAIIAGVIDAELAKGIAAIDAITEDAAEGKAAVIKACDDAKTAINDAVTAKKEETYTVTLSVTGVQTPETLQVIYGGTITAPAAPKPAGGKLFDGWYTAETEGSKFDFATKIYANTTIWARFVNIPTYATLSVKDNVVIKEDFSAYGEGQLIATDTTYGTAGIYSSKDGATVVVKNGENLAVKHNVAENTNINVAFGAVSGVVEGMFDWTANDMGSKWQVWQLVGASGTICDLYTGDKGALSFRVGGTAVANTDNSVALVKDVTYNVYFKIDLNKGTITIAINGKSFISNNSADITSVKGMTFISSSTGKRQVTLDNIVITGTIADLTAHKQALAAKLGDSAEVASAVTAINNATTAKAAYEAYCSGIKAAADAAAAKALAEAKTAALAEIEAQYPADNYRNSSTQYNNALDLVRNATTVEEVATKKQEALTTISALPDDNAVTYVLTVTFIGGGATQASLKDGATSETTITVAEDATLDTIKSWVELASTTYEITGLFKDSEGTTAYEFPSDLATVTTIYVKVEEKAQKPWKFDFTTPPNTSSNTNYSAGDVVNEILTIKTIGGGCNWNKSGYFVIKAGCEVTFTTTSAATLKITDGNSNSGRYYTVTSSNGTEVKKHTMNNGSETIVLSTGDTYTITAYGGECRINSMELTVS